MITIVLYMLFDYSVIAQMVNLEPSDVLAYANEPVMFTCNSTVQSNWRSTMFRVSFSTDTIITFLNNGGSCFKAVHKNTTQYDGKCGIEGVYMFTILNVNEQFNHQSVMCTVRYGNGSSTDTIIQKESHISVLGERSQIYILPKVTAEVNDGGDLLITCVVTASSWQSIRFIVGKTMACFPTLSSANPCEAAFPSCENKYKYTCNKTHFNVLATNVSRTLHGTQIACALETPEASKLSDAVTINVNLPLRNVNLTPSGTVNCIEETTCEFVCSATSFPHSNLSWFLDGVLLMAKSSVINGDIVTSTYNYTVKKEDDGKNLTCIGSYRDFTYSNTSTLELWFRVTKLTFEPVGSNDVITVISGRNNSFTCTTGPSRPAAMIQWYIDAKNVTNDAISHTAQLNGTMYVSSSTLVYTAKGNDNGTVVYCEAFNIEGSQKIRSTYKTMDIGYLPEKVDNVKIACVNTVLVVTWRSESDGGNKQLFKVMVQNLQTGISLHSDNISDPGVGSIVQYTSQLSVDTSYSITIESTNIYGTVKSDEIKYCNTTGLVTTANREETLSFSAGFGSGAAMIVGINVIIIIVVIMIKRRARLSDMSKVYEQTKRESSDTNMYNELEDIQSGRQNIVPEHGQSNLET